MVDGIGGRTLVTMVSLGWDEEELILDTPRLRATPLIVSLQVLGRIYLLVLMTVKNMADWDYSTGKIRCLPLNPG